MKRKNAPDHKKLLTEFGNIVRGVRKDKGLSQADLGKITGLNQKTISAIENGAEGTEISTFLRVVGSLGLGVRISGKKVEKVSTNKPDAGKIKAKMIEVVWESGQERRSVGRLSRSDKGWTFKYAPDWKVQIDPDFKLGQSYFSRALPDFFSERIPPRDSGHFAHYLKEWGVKGADLRDEMALLVTLGHRAEGNYVLEPRGFAPGRWPELFKKMA